MIQKQSAPTDDNQFINFLALLTGPEPHLSLDEPIFLTSKDHMKMAEELPLVARLISYHAIRLLAAFGKNPNATPEQQRTLNLALDAKKSIDQLCMVAEGMSRKRFPKALWMHGYQKLSEEEDPFEWLPVIAKIYKSSNKATEATTE